MLFSISYTAASILSDADQIDRRTFRLASDPEAIRVYAMDTARSIGQAEIDLNAAKTVLRGALARIEAIERRIIREKQALTQHLEAAE